MRVRSAAKVLIAACLVVAGAVALWFVPGDRDDIAQHGGQNPSPAGTGLPPAGSFEEEATRRIVAWVATGASLPGSDTPLADGKMLKERDRFLVSCDYLAEDFLLSTDQRVQRVSRDQTHPIAPSAYDGTVFVTIEWTAIGVSGNRCEFSVYVDHGYLAGGMYHISFRRDENGCLAEARMEWVK